MVGRFGLRVEGYRERFGGGYNSIRGSRLDVLRPEDTLNPNP